MAISYNTLSGLSPNDYYRELAQAFISDSWDNTAAKTPENGGKIYEQDEIGSGSYHCIEAWVKTTVGDITSGMRDSGDFIKLYFKDINHTVPRGLMYKFHDSYWICNDFGHFSGIAEDAGLRRCNNFLRIIDPENGAVFTVPCIVEYDMGSPSTQVSRYLITPNNHATIMVQGNVDTIRLFKTNTRFILSGRPFKLTGFQNALNLDLETQYDTLLYLDLYLDEIHDGDDLTNCIADNGEFDYRININSDDLVLSPGVTGKLTADVTLNGLETNKDIVWCSSNKNAVFVNSDGAYSITTKEKCIVTITAYLVGNPQVFDMIQISVMDKSESKVKIYINPVFDKIREYQTIDFNVLVSYGGVEYNPDNINISFDKDNEILSNSYLTIKQTGVGYEIYCSKRSKDVQTLYVNVSNNSPTFEASAEFNINAISMIG